MADQTLDKFYSGVLNDEIQAIPKLSDVPGLVLRRYPPQVSDPNHPKYSEWRKWQVLFINLAKSHPWAREGLRKYVLDLRADGEDVPPLLGGWAIDQFAQGEPGPAARPAGRVKSRLPSLDNVHDVVASRIHSCGRCGANRKLDGLRAGNRPVHHSQV